MRQKSILLPFLALVGGLAGLALRLWQRNLAYDPTTQLMDPGSPISVALLVFLAALAAVVLVISVTEGKASGDRFPFHCSGKWYLGLMIAGACLFFFAAAVGVPELRDKIQLWRSSMLFSATPAPMPIAQGVTLALCLAGGMGALITGRNNGRLTEASVTRNWSTLPAYAALPWLISVYQEHSVSADLTAVYLPILASAALLLALYFQSACYFDRTNLPAVRFFSTMGPALGLASLGDGLTLFQILFTLALTVTALAGLAALSWGTAPTRLKA